jgi:glycerol-3-phosphate O-acyltransferase/dihydroxyacetone phosphate acyltransferase
MRRAADQTMRALAGALVHTFFRDVEVENAEALPARAPTVVVAVHRNGLVDGLLLMVALRRYPRFLGKSTLFRIPPLWPLLKLAGVVPVYRAADGQPTSKNRATFSTSRRILRAGGVVAVFPEGISHDAPSLQALRTGAARIALEAAVDDDIHDVALVPIGISYDAKARFRSRALVRVGEPQAVSAWASLYRADPPAAVRALTEDIADHLRVVSPDYRSWTEVADLSAVAEIVARRVGTTEPEVVDLKRREELVRMLAAVVEAPGADRSSERLRAALARYQRELSLLGLDDGQVASGAGRAHFGMALGWSVLQAALSTPVAFLGTAIHIVPYEAVKRLATVPDNEGMRATVKLLGCLTGFAVVYALLARAVGKRFGPLMGTAALAFGPASGYVTVHYIERLQRIGGVVEAARLAQGRRTTLASLLSSRAAVVEEAGQLLTDPMPEGAVDRAW